MTDTHASDPLAIETRETTAKLLGVSVCTLDREIDIPRVRLAARRYGYRRCDIAKWLEDRLEETPRRSRSAAEGKAEERAVTRE